MLLQDLSQVQGGFSQESVGLQGVVAPHFEIQLCVTCYIPRNSTHAHTHTQLEVWILEKQPKSADLGVKSPLLSAQMWEAVTPPLNPAGSGDLAHHGQTHLVVVACSNAQFTHAEQARRSQRWRREQRQMWDGGGAFQPSIPASPSQWPNGCVKMEELVEQITQLFAVAVVAKSATPAQHCGPHSPAGAKRVHSGGPGNS